MQKPVTVGIGVLVVLVGAALWLFARDTEFFWFRGGPLGIVLVVIGAIELVGALGPRRPNT